MASFLERAKARVVSTNKPQAPLINKSSMTNDIQKRGSTLEFTSGPARQKRLRTHSLGPASAAENTAVSSSVNKNSSKIAASSSQSIVEQLQAQVLKLVNDQAEDRARFQSKLAAQDNHLQRLQEKLDDRRSIPAYPRPPTALSDGSHANGPDERDMDYEEVKKETSVLNIYDESPEPPQNRRSISRQSAPTLQSQKNSSFEEDVNLPPVTTQAIAFYDGMQMPYVIRGLAPCDKFELPARPNERFSHEFLKKVFGGSPISNGCYKIPAKNRQRRLFPDLDIYRVLKAEHDPLLPRHPGQHGAQISCIFSDEEIEGDFPLFICDSGAGTGYRYYGTYREPRASDIIGGSEMCCVPDHVKQFWAKLLGMQNGNGKSSNALDTLIHEWPRVSVG
ncbi:hypothetical protein ONS95_012536 [Cadophora gregata]|uniref:uncharacterized protein n=1 Tax=Cadophora gregata TaxID=51156 RepID=UPI0026DD233C|nr:uncharacterized protein ONS95_012536 [Cadophora gregata]KAK0118233.1 hypothetical protein ONS95_012536 [Cadophora gregata]